MSSSSPSSALKRRVVRWPRLKTATLRKPLATPTLMRLHQLLKRGTAMDHLTLRKLKRHKRKKEAMIIMLV